MPQSLAKVYLHVIFSTKDRKPFVTPKTKPILEAYIVSVASNLGIYTEGIYMNSDHVHWLCTLPRTLTIADMIQKVKIPSSNKMTEIGPKDFHWQKGYGTFSVSQSKLDIVKKYIQNQEEHHKHMTFQEEYLKFLEEYGIDYDLKYVWD
ncbi:IS200/IS605 family transposase [Algoriphagus yeomjeoni]|uniref:REP element-mobilizing transposase RayT n=1 Tax=Algoriphagus yeomjeoni TaxID=291403 RepID=A0A327P8C6_9BACT|nr:IS200/IS605 family transposase [Algoriphagus yeomjeoni]RAI88489.1 REP element-mobilizing transposase RayT [Algoriphagus yeomjeoni]